MHSQTLSFPMRFQLRIPSIIFTLAVFALLTNTRASVEAFQDADARNPAATSDACAPPSPSFPEIPDDEPFSFETVESIDDDDDDDDDEEEYVDDNDDEDDADDMDGEEEEGEEESKEEVEEEEEAEEGDDSNANGGSSRHDRNKRFVFTKRKTRRRGGSRKSSSSTSSPSSQSSGPASRSGTSTRSGSSSSSSTRSGSLSGTSMRIGSSSGSSSRIGSSSGSLTRRGSSIGSSTRSGGKIKITRRFNIRKKTSKLTPLTPKKTSSPKIGSLTAEQKTLILNRHNEYRGRLPGVPGYPISNIPRAQDMQKMVWDEDLEKKAKIHAEKCLSTQDGKGRHLDNLNIGQNIANDSNVEKAVAKWYGEIAICKWDLSGENAAKRQNKGCTEYAQLVWSNSSRLGCASAWCPESPDTPHAGYNLVCNYGPEGNAVHTMPYTPAGNDQGICQKCPGKCLDGLCNCDGKVCYNGGILDVRTCQCSCHSLWKGPSCLEMSCPPIDNGACGIPYPKGYPKSYCTMYNEVKSKCPYMCGVCKGARCGGKKCVNGGKLDLKTCECQCRKIFTGDTCKVLKCPPKDSWFCGTTWDKSYCKRIITAQFECPYMCKICKK